MVPERFGSTFGRRKRENGIGEMAGRVVATAAKQVWQLLRRICPTNQR